MNFFPFNNELALSWEYDIDLVEGCPVLKCALELQNFSPVFFFGVILALHFGLVHYGSEHFISEVYML